MEAPWKDTNLPSHRADQYRMMLALHRLPVFREVTASQIFALVAHAEFGTFGTPDTSDVVVPRTHRGEPWVLLVLDGELRIDFDGTEDPSDRTHVNIGSGDCYGELAFVTRRLVQGRLIALRPSTVLFFHRREFDELFRTSASFRRGVLRGWETLSGQLQLPGTGTARAHTARLFPKPSAELVVLETGAGEEPVATDGLTALLAMAVAEDFKEDDVLLVRQARPDEPVTNRVERVGQLRVLAIRPGTLASALARRAYRYDYVFVQTGEGAAGRADLEPYCDRISRVRLWRHSPTIDQTSDRTTPQVLETVLLADRGTPRPSRRFWGRDTDLSEGTGLDRGTPRLENRLVLDPAAVETAWRRLGPRGIADIRSANGATVSRWARCLTGRCVGLALGGGGAWGYAHVALIRALHGKGVPIDVISSASFGSVVGAYYSVLGRDGLDLLVERGRRLGYISRVSMVTTRLLEEQLARDLGDVRLEQTPILFHPFATNLSTRRGAAFNRGRVARAVRASSSAPGVFGPTIVPLQGRYVDGCIVDNVPTVVLYGRSALVRIAANIYPPPGERPATESRVGVRLTQVNPLARIIDAGASGSLMLHFDGVREAASATVHYDVKDPHGTSPLMTASEFGNARQILEWANEDDALMRAAEDARLQWQDISGMEEENP